MTQAISCYIEFTQSFDIFDNLIYIQHLTSIDNLTKKLYCLEYTIVIISHS